MEDILYTDFFLYEHSQTGSTSIACDEYHIPAHITEHVDYITPGIRLRREPGKLAPLRRRGQSEVITKRGHVASHTGITAIPENIKVSASSDDTPFNSSACATYVSQVCIRSKSMLSSNPGFIPLRAHCDRSIPHPQGFYCRSRK